jgi:hypothetical protein
MKSEIYNNIIVALCVCLAFVISLYVSVAFLGLDVADAVPITVNITATTTIMLSTGFIGMIFTLLALKMKIPYVPFFLGTASVGIFLTGWLITANVATLVQIFGFIKKLLFLP